MAAVSSQGIPSPQVALALGQSLQKIGLPAPPPPATPQGFLDHLDDMRRIALKQNCVDYCEFDAINMSYRHQLAEFNIKNLKIGKIDLIKQAGTIRDFWNK